MEDPWIKKGRIFDPSHSDMAWIKSHAALPTTLLIDKDTVRIYFSTRDEQGRSVPTFLEAQADNPKNIKYIHSKPILPLGKLGTFDDNGIMPSSLVKKGGDLYLYYIGWNPQQTVSYRLSIGLAVSKDGGLNFEKISQGPICDRSIDEPFFNTAPCVLKTSEEWKMWYVSCTKWEIINNWPEPYYHIKYATSKNGINWNKTGIVCIDYDKFADAYGKPFVYFDKGIYKMFYSFRSARGYRDNKNQSYRLGYAESHDGITWKRQDNEAGITTSDDGWDSTMIEYCSIYEHQNRLHMIYNGNGFGDSGFGWATKVKRI